MDGIFGIGPLELILIAILALIVLGPERLPGVMREGAKYIRQMRRLGNELTANFSEELRALDEINPRKILSEMTDPNQPEAGEKPAPKPAPKPAAASTKTAAPQAPATTVSSAAAIAKASGMPVAPQNTAAAPSLTTPVSNGAGASVQAAESVAAETVTTAAADPGDAPNSILPPGRTDSIATPAPLPAPDGAESTGLPPESPA